MTERSLPWPGTATGDAGTYTADEWRQVLETVAGFRNTNRGGVVGGVLNSLRPNSPGNDQIKADTGRAIVDGTVYEADVAVTKTMTTPVVGTTGKRLVLQKGWTAQTVRMAVISSADGTASLPALTQSDGVTWEISLSWFTHATSGVIAAVTDEREFTNAVAIQFIIDGAGAAIATGEKGHLVIPRALHLYGWELLADQSGSILVDVWKDTYANFPPANADSICGTDEPEIVTAAKAQNINVVTAALWTLAR